MYVTKVESTAKEIYSKIKFDPAAGFGEYSDPLKIAREAANYASSVRFCMNVSNPQTDGEQLMELLVAGLGANSSKFTDIMDIPSALGKNEYVIENYANYDFSHYDETQNPVYPNSGFINIGSDISGTSYDVAHALWGDSWQMPSADQCRELINKTTSSWKNQNGVNG